MLKSLLIGLALAFVLLGPGTGNIVSVSNAEALGYVPQTSNAGEIKVTVTPRDVSVGAKTWDFDVTLETHTKSLSDDLSKSSTLIADGKRYMPSGWEGAPPGGHHRKGVLRFKAIDPAPAFIELQVRLKGEPSPRSFQWMLKGKAYGS